MPARPNKTDRPAHVAFLDELAREEHEGWAILTRPARLRLPSGHTYSLTKLGKGAFTTAYEVADLGAVIAEVHDVRVQGDMLQVDFSKSILSELDSDNPHLPYVRFIGSTRDAQLFGMPKYKVPLRKVDSPVAWAQRAALERCSMKAFLARKRGARGHEIRQQALECMEGQVPALLFDAVSLISDYANNYGDDFFFEFPARNLGTDDAGNLILLDVLFDRGALAMRRKNPSSSPLGWFENALRPNGRRNILRSNEPGDDMIRAEWLVEAERRLAETQDELAMTKTEWEAHFNERHPGLGYTATLQKQEARLVRDIATAREKSRSNGRRTNTPRRYGIRTTYDIVTPESAEDGDVAERGFIGSGRHRYETSHLHGPSRELADIAEDATLWFEDEDNPVEEAVRFLRREGASMESTSGVPTVRDWYSTTSDDPYSGESETRSFRLVGDWTLDDAHAIYEALTTRPNASQIYVKRVTNNLGRAGFIATAKRKSASMNYDHALGAVKSSQRAAEKLAERLGWHLVLDEYGEAKYTERRTAEGVIARIYPAVQAARSNGRRRNGPTVASVRSEIRNYLDTHGDEMMTLRNGRVTWHGPKSDFYPAQGADARRWIPNLPDVGPIREILISADMTYHFDAYPADGGYELTFRGALPPPSRRR